MVLRVPETPEHARAAVCAVLEAPRRRPAPPQADADDPDPLDAAGEPGATAEPSFSAVCPHRMFEIDLTDLAEGRGLDTARPVGWRWLVHDGGRTVGAVEVADPGTGHTVARYTEGPFTTCTDAAMATVRSLPQIEHGYYELRLLHIPALYTVALWLADLVGWQDLLVPLAPAPPGVQPLRPYPALELAGLLGNRGRALLPTAPQT